MDNEVFTAEVAQVLLEDGVAYIRFRGKAPGSEGGEDAPLAHELLMSPDGFLNLFTQVENSVRQIVENSQNRAPEGGA